MDLLKKLKELADERSPFMWLDKIEDAVAAAGRLNELHSAAKEDAGVRAGNQNSHNFAELHDRLEDEYRPHRRAETWKTIRTELKPFVRKSESSGLKQLGRVQSHIRSRRASDPDPRQRKACVAINVR